MAIDRSISKKDIEYNHVKINFWMNFWVLKPNPGSLFRFNLTPCSKNGQNIRKFHIFETGSVATASGDGTCFNVRSVEPRTIPGFFSRLDVTPASKKFYDCRNG